MPADFDFSFELIGWNEFELNLVDHWLSSAFNENRNGCFLWIAFLIWNKKKINRNSDLKLWYLLYSNYLFGRAFCIVRWFFAVGRFFVKVFVEWVDLLECLIGIDFSCWIHGGGGSNCIRSLSSNAWLWNAWCCWIVFLPIFLSQLI